MTDERRQRLARYNETQQGRFSDRDLGIIAHFGIRSRAIAEHLIWDDRDAILDDFDDLTRAAAGQRSGPSEGQARYEALLRWRELHRDQRVRSVSDADLGRLATASITSGDDLGRVAATLSDGIGLIGYADELLQVLGVRRAEQDTDVDEAASAAGRQAEQESAPASAPAPQQTPPPPPEPEPEPEAEVPDPSKPFEWVQVARYKPFDWSSGNAEAVGHVVATTVDGTVQIEWTEAPEQAPVTLYRIVQSSDSWPTGAPEMASPVGTTMATAGSVPLRPRGNVTYLAIWANQGTSLLAASQSQPVLIGSSEVVWPPTELTLNVTADDVVAASWNAPEGSTVEVQRFPKGIPVAYDPARLLPPEAVSSGGFLDREPPLGEEIVYAAFSVAQLPSGGSSVSAPVTAEIHITPDAQPVQLDVKRSKTVPGTYDITWVPPAHGRVVLYATPTRPPQGLENEARTREIIENEGLKPQRRITYPAKDMGGIKTIQGFAVDRTWVRAHFVAVHWVSDELVWVGPPVSMVTPMPPARAEIIERVDAQVVTFPWPSGVSIVRAYQSPKGSDLDPTTNQPIASLTRADYDKTGGMRITRTLPSNGCSLHLFGVLYLDGQPVYSEPVSVDYDGITRLRYEFVPMLANQQEAPPGAQPAMYRLFATVDDELHGVPIVLISNPARLPLDPSDGQILQEAVVSLAAGQRTFVGDIPAGMQPLHVRMFINRSAHEVDTIAVLDPRLESMQMWV